MASDDTILPSEQSELLRQILASVQSLQHNYIQLSAVLESVQGQINALTGPRRFQDRVENQAAILRENDSLPTPEVANDPRANASITAQKGPALPRTHQLDALQEDERDETSDSLLSKKSSAALTSRIILTTYPNQSGIDPLILKWGCQDPLERGPVVVSRNQNTIRRRNGMPLVP